MNLDAYLIVLEEEDVQVRVHRRLGKTEEWEYKGEKDVQANAHLIGFFGCWRWDQWQGLQKSRDKGKNLQ